MFYRWANTIETVQFTYNRYLILVNIVLLIWEYPKKRDFTINSRSHTCQSLHCWKQLKLVKLLWIIISVILFSHQAWLYFVLKVSFLETKLNFVLWKAKSCHHVLTLMLVFLSLARTDQGTFKLQKKAKHHKWITEDVSIDRWLCSKTSDIHSSL